MKDMTDFLKKPNGREVLAKAGVFEQFSAAWKKRAAIAQKEVAAELLELTKQGLSGYKPIGQIRNNERLFLASRPYHLYIMVIDKLEFRDT